LTFRALAFMGENISNVSLPILEKCPINTSLACISDIIIDDSIERNTKKEPTPQSQEEEVLKKANTYGGKSGMHE